MTWRPYPASWKRNQVELPLRIHLLAVSDRQPAWVQAGFDEFSKRLVKECQLDLRELAPAKRAKTGHPDRWREEEWGRIAAAVPKGAPLIALDERGECVDTQNLSRRLERWLQGGSDVCLVIGGADGLHPDCLAAAQWRWSLSPLTLPHGLVRVVVAEQLYRAWSILKGHPYHRG